MGVGTAHRALEAERVRSAAPALASAYAAPLDRRTGDRTATAPSTWSRAQPLGRATRSIRAVSARKRVFDFVLASAALVVLAPLLGLIWTLVRITSPGPGVHWSPRSGRNGLVFMMPKFRTMKAATPQQPREGFANADTFITPLGKFLRRTSLDELPQLISVIRGDMSLIGPRPLVPADPAQLARQEFPETLLMRPGMSGLAQVRGRNLVSPRRKARLDAFYARARSGWFDIEIIARTIRVLISGRGFI